MTPSRALARVNLAAIERNCALLRARIGGATELCAVVKANGYGHGAVAAARAAQAGGASWLAVAAAREAAGLRAAGIDGPLLVLGALTAHDLEIALDASADVVAWDADFAERASAAAQARGTTAGIHLKLDVGMGRLGTRDPDTLLAVGRRVLELPALRLAGGMTHFPSADEDVALTRRELAAFTAFGARLRELAPDAILHAGNSAAALGLPESRLDMVRCGIAVYGLDPWGRDAAEHGLEPALELRSYVAALKPIAPGQTVGYGATFTATAPSWIATLPIGYGDGFRRAFSNNGVALLGGRRVPLVGRVSMDNVCVDVGPDPGELRVGDPAVLIGAVGEERIAAEELAGLIGTINYEITTALTSRVVWEHHSDGEPA